MPSLLHCFGRTTTHIDHDGLVVFESNDTGSYNVGLGAGAYYVVLIGGGGGGAYCHYAAGHDLFDYYAQGGVAATFQGYLQVMNDCDVVVTLGDRGQTNSAISQGQVDVSGTSGTSSSIVGIPDITLSAGGGTFGKIVGGNSRTAGTMGVLTIFGSHFLKVDMNSNEHLIWSSTAAGYRRNTNYPTNNIFGQGGGRVNGYSGTDVLGGKPYCLIEKVEREHYEI